MFVNSISPRDLKQMLDAGGPLAFLDVREDIERSWCVIVPSGSVVDLHIPLSQLPLRAAEVKFAPLPTVVYCHHGVRSMVAARWLAARGVQGLVNLAGGIDAWSEEIDPAVPRY